MIAVYSGETRAKVLRARLVAMGFGVVVVRGRVGKADIAAWLWRWFYDNMAFADWRAGRSFDEPAFMADILRILDMPEDQRPAFITLPDVVAGGLASLRLSIAWLHRLGRLRLRFALVVQDGMTPADVPWDAPWHVLFVGGSKPWKLDTMGAWARAAHAHGRPCHVGRIGSGERYLDAKAADVDSIDSALFLFSEENLFRFLRSRSKPAQMRLDF